MRKNLLPVSFKRNVDRWRELRTVDDLAVLFRLPQHKIQLHSLKPEYRQYKIPKKDGSLRLIEDPVPALKNIQRKINFYLQAHYFYQRPACVHGFTTSPKYTEKRSILTNAQVHLNQPYLINIDLEDFFHQVHANLVRRIFRRQFKAMSDDLVELLVRLTTRWERLPMGAPTSPCLSNYACLSLDANLEALTYQGGWQYTRFADDLSFSGDARFSKTQLEVLRNTISSAGFHINTEKFKSYGPDDVKVVTGLYLQEGRIGLPPQFLTQLDTEIQRLQAVMLVEGRYQTGMSMRKLKLLKQELQGKINFAGLVMGQAHPDIMAREDEFLQALQAREDYESASWLDIPYSTDYM